MAANIGEIRSKVSTRIHDTDSKLTTLPDLTCDVDRAILDALEQYQKTRPLQKTVKLDGDGGFDYAVSSLTGFVDGFSVVVDVVYPYVSTDQVIAACDRLDAIAHVHRAVRFRGSAVHRHAAQVAGLRRQGARLEDARDVQPLVAADGHGIEGSVTRGCTPIRRREGPSLRAGRGCAVEARPHAEPRAEDPRVDLP